MENLIHITYDKAGAENLKQSFALDDIISGEIVTFDDDLASGTLKDSATEETLSRQGWWNKIKAPEEYASIHRDHELLTDLCQRMREDENSEIWIWAAQNARDVCGYYALLHPLSSFLGRVHLIYLNNLPFMNDKGGIFYPSQLSEILPKEFLKARKLAREITAAEVEIDGEEWNRLKEENASIRILEGAKKISSKPDDYFDKELINRCRLDYMKAWRLVNQIIQKSKDHINEDFLYWRLQELINNGTFNAKEAFKNLRDSEVKTAGTEVSEGTETNTTSDGKEQ
ncbi:MAG: DUF1835 domain-containing protein [Chitinophagaceae bacterium]|nr:MAG: DUF1835 domain-containing protein [Chitinophagaceae bacterium]